MKAFVIAALWSSDESGGGEVGGVVVMAYL